MLYAFLTCTTALSWLPPAEAQTYDSYVLIQPIRVCDDAGNNCAQVTNFPVETRTIYAQAKILPVFLPLNQINNTNLLTQADEAEDMSGGESAIPNTVNAWFVADLDPGGSGTLFGEAVPGLVVNGTAVANFNGGNGRRDTFAHELGHVLGLGHGDFGAGGADNLMTAGDTRSVPGGVGDINPNGAQLSKLTQDQIDEMRSSGFVQMPGNCDGDGGVNVITKTFGEACLNLNGQGGNDILTLTGGVVVQDLTGGAGDDIITIAAGTVGGNVLGGDNNDTIMLAPGVVVVGNVDGGSGNDKITVAADPLNIFGGIGDDIITIDPGTVVTQSVFGDDGDGNEGNGDGNDTITINGGSIGVNVAGEGGDDKISINGGTIGGSVLGGGGVDTIVVSGGTITGNVEGGIGGDLITLNNGTITGNLDGGADGDTINVNGGSVANVLGGDGVDIIALNNGTITGNLDGGNDGDTITVNGGSVANVLGGAGVDLITLNNGTITGNLDGGDNGDTINVNGGSVANVLGGAGVDLITLNNGTITGNLDGGNDGDTITIQGGSVANVLGGAGADRINLLAGSIGVDVDGGSDGDTIVLNGSTVAGDILGGGGNDRIEIRSGSVTSVRAGADDDTGFWNGGNVANLINMGAGSDTLDIHGVAVGGAAFQAGLSELHGGDDASSADGQVDTLNLRGVVEVLTELKGWENINLLDTSVGNLGPNSRTIVTEQFSIEHGSTLVANSGGQTYVIDGNLTNAGYVNMQSFAPVYDTLKVTGTYAGLSGGGQNALLGVDSFLGVVGSPSDLMVVGNGVTGGTAGATGLVVNDTNPGPGVFNPIGIEVVRVETASLQTAKEHFLLIDGATNKVGPIQKDLWIWDLGLDTTRSIAGRENADVHVLYSRPSDVVQATPYFGTGALTAFHSSLEPWIDRQHTLADSLVREHARGARRTDAPSRHVDLWVAPFGARRAEDSVSKLTFFGDTFTTQMDYTQNTYGLQAGVDFISKLGNGNAFMAGAFGGFLNSSLAPNTVPVRGEYEGGSVGAYASYMYGSLVLSAVFKADLLSFDWRAPTLDLKANTDVNTYGGRVEAAYKHYLSPAGTSWLEPYANLTYAKSYWDQFTVLETTFAINDNESLLGRLGVRVGADMRSNQNLFKVFAGAGLAYEFNERNTANILSGGFTLPLTHKVDTTSLELQGGVRWTDIDKGLSLSITSTGRFSEDAQEYGGKATLNVQF